MPGGMFDTEVILTERYHWPKSVLDVQDTDYVEELLIYMDAESTHNAVLRRRQEQQERREKARRR